MLVAVFHPHSEFRISPARIELPRCLMNAIACKVGFSKMSSKQSLKCAGDDCSVTEKDRTPVWKRKLSGTLGIPASMKIHRRSRHFHVFLKLRTRPANSHPARRESPRRRRCARTAFKPSPLVKRAMLRNAVPRRTYYVRGNPRRGASSTAAVSDRWRSSHPRSKLGTPDLGLAAPDLLSC